MARLTYSRTLRCDNGEICKAHKGVCGDENSGYCPELQRAIDRLSAYEDTGLKPEEIKNDRLRELAQADSEGRCVVLPDVPDKTKQFFAENLQDVFNEWRDSDPSIGIFGMSEDEGLLADAIMAALGGGGDG